MVKCLQTDGVDDVAYYTQVGNLSVDEVVIDCVVSTGRAAFDKYFGSANSSYYQRNGSSQDQWAGGWSAAYINGVSVVNSTNAVPLDTRITIRLTASTAIATNAYYVFANNPSGSGSMPGKIYRVTFKNAGATVIDWDFTTGTGTDQSGNGRNATIVGATFVDDGTGGTPTGTDGSTSFDLRQSLYSDGAANGDMKQSLFADNAVSADLRQSFYSDSFTAFDSFQAIYSDSATGYDTRLSFYSDASTLFDTLQEFFSDGIVGSTPFDIRMVLYADNAAVFDSKQAVYSDNAVSADLAQQFYQAGANSADLKLVIYADASSKFDASQTIYSDSSVKADTAQRFFTDGTIDFDTLQAILEDWNEYHEVIRMVLNITQSKASTLGITQRMQSELKM